ncbi:uncharacterized protein LOC131615726 [Vicia villosa]|uniref:uncharacterized protein LOC131615726 n=1 Tax=Vicia villosa TaxID=3911 RepID=UPI00273B3255|nr:uncharacterized protein LOC131615726 [Vicia villosa]
MKQTSSSIAGPCSYESNTKNDGFAANLRWRPVCGCGEIALLRRASTSTNFGKQFWGCRNYKGSTQTGCGYFQWFFDDVMDEKDQYMKMQNSRMEKIQIELDAAKMELVTLKATNDRLKQKTRELKKMLNSEKNWKRLFCVILVLVIWKSLY